MPFVSPTLVDSDGGIIWVGYKARGEFIVQRKDDGKNQDRPETGTNPPQSPRAGGGGPSKGDGRADFRILFYDYIVAESSTSEDIEDDLSQAVREVDRAKIPEEVKANIYDKQGFYFELFQNLFDQQQRELVHRFLDANRVEDAKKQFEKDPQCLRYADRGGYTPLHRCAINDLVEPARLFLTHSLRWQSQQHDEPTLMDVNAMDGRRWTPLHWACYKFNPKMIEFLIKEALCRTSCLTDKLATPLQLLSLHPTEDKLVSVLYMLTDRGVDLDAQDIDGNTALHLASLHGSVAAAQFLLSNRADPNIQNKEGDTPLHFAVLGRHEKIVEMLMDNRADPQIVSPKNGSPADFAKKLGLNQVAVIIETMASLQLPQGAITAGSAAAAPTTSTTTATNSSSPGAPPELGASVPSSSPFSDSILARDGSSENILSSSFVVGSYKADPFVKRMRKMSEAIPMTGRRMPIHDLVIRGQYKRVKQVIEGKKAAIDLRDQNRWTPVLLAAAHGYLNIVELLVEAGADLTCVDQDQSGLLHFVARNRLTLQAAPRISKLVSSLVERKFDLNAPNIHGVTALHEACVRGQVPLARALLENGANIEAATKNGESPLIWAAREGRVDVVSFLLGRGASRLTRGRWGTAVDVARGACQFDVVKVLLFFDGNSTSDSTNGRPSLGSSRRGLRAALQAPAEGVVNAASRAVDTMKEIASIPVHLVGTALTMSGITPAAPTEEAAESDAADSIIEEEEPTQDQVDLSPIFNIMEPILFQTPCRANFEAGKDKPNNFSNVSGWLGIWQSCAAFYASDDHKIKMDYSNLKEVRLQKFLFAETRVVLQDLDGISKLEIMNKEDILSISNIVQFLFANRSTKTPIILDGQPIVAMVGSIRFPAENTKFHQLFKIDAGESLVEHFACTWKEKSAAGRLFVSAERVCFAKRESELVNIPFSEVKAIKKIEKEKAIVFESLQQNFTFTGFVKIDSAFRNIEALWKETQTDGRIVMLTSPGRRARQLGNMIIDGLTTMHDPSNPGSVYVRWLMVQNKHNCSDADKASLKAKNVDVISLNVTGRAASQPLQDALRQMRKLVIVLLEYDQQVAETALALIRSCTRAISQVVVVSYMLGSASCPLADSTQGLEALIERYGQHFTFVHISPALMQLFQDEFVDIKHEWRICLPLGGERKLAWLDLRDVAEVVNAVVTSPAKDRPHDRRIYYISGPEAISTLEVAEIFSDQVDNEVRFIPCPVSTLKEMVAFMLFAQITAAQQAQMSQQQQQQAQQNAEVTPGLAGASIVTKLNTLRKPPCLEYDLDWMLSQYTLIFSELEGQELHSIVSSITEDIAGQPPRSFLNFIEDSASHFKEKVKIMFLAKQHEAIVKQFQSLVDKAPPPSSGVNASSGSTSSHKDLSLVGSPPISTSPLTAASFVSIGGSNTASASNSSQTSSSGTISVSGAGRFRLQWSQFSRAWGALFQSDIFLLRLFRAFDVDGSNEINVSQFVSKMSVLVNGSVEQQLRFAFDMFDDDQDQLVGRDDLNSVCGAAADILTLSGITPRVVKSLFFASGFQGFPTDPVTQKMKDRINLAEFSSMIQKNRLFIESLGEIQSLDALVSEQVEGLKKNDVEFSKSHLFPDPVPPARPQMPNVISSLSSEDLSSEEGLSPVKRARQAPLTPPPPPSSPAPPVPSAPSTPTLSISPSPHRPSDAHLGARRASGYKKSLTILPGHQLWETCLRIASGISKSVTKQIRFAQSRRAFAAAKSSDDFLSFDEETEEVISGEPAFGDDGLVFVDYAPSVFAQIRELHGIPQRAYLHSLGIERIIGGLLLGKLHSFEEVVSTGRSGSFFLRSADGKYLIKSLPIEEHSFFRRILKAYYTHVKHYPSTFLARFLGLHRIKNPKDPKQDLYFVVMENLFDTPLDIHEQYDLKGSTVNRFVGEKMEMFNPSVALKDLDFHRRLRVGPVMKALMLEQAEIDCMWMESLNICDYSMLVGLHYMSASVSTPVVQPSSAATGARPRRNTASAPITEDSLKQSLTSHSLDRSRFRRHFGGIKSVGSTSGEQDGLEDVVYFIGLIDILTQYDFNKKVEHNLKSIVYKKNEISAVAPEPYRKRLLWYMSSIID